MLSPNPKRWEMKWHTATICEDNLFKHWPRICRTQQYDELVLFPVAKTNNTLRHECRRAENGIEFRVRTFQVVLRNFAYHINHVNLMQIKSTSHYSAGSTTQLHEVSFTVWVQNKHDDNDDTQQLQLVKLLSNPTDGVVCLYSYRKFVLHSLDRACAAISSSSSSK
jgi:hypothetical protein